MPVYNEYHRLKLELEHAQDLREQERDPQMRAEYAAVIVEIKYKMKLVQI